MIKQRTGVTVKFLALAAIFGIGALSAMALWGCSGCSRTSEYGQSPNAEGLWGAGIRPAMGDTTRLLRNAHYLKLMGRPEMALKELEGAYQENPGNLRVLDTLARTYEEVGEFDRAQKLYQQALALDPSNQALNNNLCFSYYLTGQYAQAETCFRQALDKNPQNITVRNNLGLLLCRLGRSEEARRLWQEAEGEMAAQKKMQQVMVALGAGEPSHYAQSVPPASAPAPVASVSRPAPPSLTPPPRAPKPITPAVAALPSAAAPQPRPVPAAVQHHQKPPALVTAGKPAPPQPHEPAQVTKAKKEPAPVNQPAATAVQEKPAPAVLAAPQPRVQKPPAPPKQTADPVKKPTPATTPPPPPKPGKATQVALAPKPAPLTAEELEGTGIEVTNGTSAPHLARHTRTRLSEEGFHVVSIGNYRDYSVEKTVVYCRPGAEDVARALIAKFFPKSKLEGAEKFAKGADVKILLGKDAAEPSAVASESASAAEKIAAGVGSGHPELKAAAPAATPAPAAAQAKAPAPASLPVSSAVTAKAAPRATRDHPYLTAAELETMGIDIRNGTPTPDLAHKARAMLSQEGFNVVHIGNHIDFGAEKTVIYYRQDAEKMARNLNTRFFPQSQMEQSAKLPEDVAIKVLLGKDLLHRTDVMAKLSD